MNFSRATKIAAICAGVALVSAALLAVLVLSQKRAAELKTRDWIVKTLEQRFHSDVDLDDFRVKVFPKMQVLGKGLMLHYWSTPDAPPLIRIERFSFELGFLGIFRAPHRIARVHIERMVVTIPPRTQRQAGPPRRPIDQANLPQVVIGELECDQTEILILSARPDRDPLDWEIHHLLLREAGAGKPFAFHGTLTNAKPKGEIATNGEFGPWNDEDPGSTRVSGTYGFAGADLGPFPGIAGTLSSNGHYTGELDELDVHGETDTPNFSLDNVGKPVPLHTDYSATVDGTNGDTLLHPVHAILGQSVLVAAGSVVNAPGRQGHQITLDVTSSRARIEDILQLAINSSTPLLRGPVEVKAKLSLPPGNQKVIEKMTLNGSVVVSKGRWSNPAMREKLESFSRHAEGKPEDEEAGSAVTDLQGRFVLEHSVLTFSSLTFSVPGAAVELAGTYNLRSEQIDLHGHLKMQAKLSQMVTGAKSFFLKAIDPLFSKHGAGTELPISITGTQENPVFGTSVFRKKFERRLGKPKNP